MPVDSRTRRACWAIFGVTLATRLLFVAVTRPFGIQDGTEEVAIAHSLAAENTFANPFRVPTGPTAHSSPAYPFLLSLVYRALPQQPRTAELVKEILSTVATGAQFALLPLLAATAGLPLAAGLAAGLLGALLPLHPYLEVKGEWTAVWCGLALLLLTFLLVRSWQAKQVSTWKAAARGAAFGIALWFTPVFLPVMVGWLIAELWLARRRITPGRMSAVLVSAATMTLFQVPWALRNAEVLGKPVWSRDNFGLELQLAFQDYALPYYLDTRTNLTNHGVEFQHPNSSAKEAARVREVGEIAYNAAKLEQAKTWMSGHPVRSLQLIASRTLGFWFPYRIGVARFLLHSGISLIALWGWWLLRRRHWLLFVALGVIWLAYPLVYYIIQNEPRYAYPIFWSKLLAAGSLWPLVRRRNVFQTTPR